MGTRGYPGHWQLSSILGDIPDIGWSLVSRTLTPEWYQGWTLEYSLENDTQSTGWREITWALDEGWYYGYWLQGDVQNTGCKVIPRALTEVWHPKHWQHADFQSDGCRAAWSRGCRMICTPPLSGLSSQNWLQGDVHSGRGKSGYAGYFLKW